MRKKITHERQRMLQGSLSCTLANQSTNDRRGVRRRGRGWGWGWGLHRYITLTPYGIVTLSCVLISCGHSSRIWTLTRLFLRYTRVLIDAGMKKQLPGFFFLGGGVSKSWESVERRIVERRKDRKWANVSNTWRVNDKDFMSSMISSFILWNLEQREVGIFTYSLVPYPYTHETEFTNIVQILNALFLHCRRI